MITLPDALELDHLYQVSSRLWSEATKYVVSFRSHIHGEDRYGFPKGSAWDKEGYREWLVAEEAVDTIAALDAHVVVRQRIREISLLADKAPRKEKASP